MGTPAFLVPLEQKRARRDEFAKVALQALVSTCEFDRRMRDLPSEESVQWLARCAYVIARAMEAERKRQLYQDVPEEDDVEPMRNS